MEPGSRTALPMQCPDRPDGALVRTKESDLLCSYEKLLEFLGGVLINVQFRVTS